MECAGQHFCVYAYLGRVASSVCQSEHTEYQKGDDHGRYGRQHHIPDMAEERNPVEG